MTDDRELREAFRSLVGSEPRPSADVLAGMQPRLRRARLVRGAGVAALVVPVIAGLGFALSSIDRSGEVAQTVSTDGGVAEVDDLDPPTATPLPEPDPSDEESGDEGVIVIPTPPATPLPASETNESDDAPEQAEIGEQSSVVPSPSPSTEGQPPPVASPGPEPTPVATPSPAASPVLSMQYTSVGGTVDVEYTASVITKVEFSPASGFTGEIHEQHEREAKVIFSGPGDDIEIEIHLEDGQLTFQESGD